MELHQEIKTLAAKLGVILRCLSVREGVFDPDRDFVNKEYVGDAGDPY